MQQITRTFQVITADGKIESVVAHHYRRGGDYRLEFVDADGEPIAVYDRGAWLSFHEIATDATCVSVMYNGSR